MTAKRIGWCGAIGTTLSGIVPGEAVEVGVDRRPVGRHVGLAVGERRRAPQLGAWRRPGSGAQPNPSGAGQVRGDALEQRAPDLAVAAQRGLRVRVGVDEARRDDAAGGIDGGGGGRVGDRPDGHDPPVPDRDVGGDARRARPVDDGRRRG